MRRNLDDRNKARLVKHGIYARRDIQMRSTDRVQRKKMGRGSEPVKFLSLYAALGEESKFVDVRISKSRDVRELSGRVTAKLKD